MVEKLTWPQHLASLLAVVTIFMAGFLIGSNYLRPDPNVIEDAARCNKELVRAMSAHGQGQVAYENQDWKTLGKVRDEEAAHLREMGVACWPKER